MRNRESDRVTRWLRWIARGVGTLVGGIFLLVGIAEAIVDATPWSWEGAVLAGLVLVALLSIAFAWRWEGIGGTAVIGSAVALGIFAYVTARFNKGWAMLMTGGPLLVSGILFLVSWWRSRGATASRGGA